LGVNASQYPGDGHQANRHNHTVKNRMMKTGPTRLTTPVAIANQPIVYDEKLLAGITPPNLLETV